MNKLFVLSMMLVVLMAGSVAAMSDRADTKVRVFHASPDAPSVDVWVNDQPGLLNVSYNEVTDYVKLSKDEYNFKVVPSGMMDPVVIDATLDLLPHRDYTIVAFDYLSNIKPLVIADARLTIIKKKAMVRFVHTSPDAPAVDIAVKNGPVVFDNVAFGEQTNYAVLNPGMYDLEVRVAGTDIVALELPGIEFNKATAYSAFAIGELADESLTAALVVDRGINS